MISTSQTERRDGGFLQGIQALRALAAISVALSHGQSYFVRKLALPDALPNLQFGAAGVDLFFVISGFIMVHSSERLFGNDGSWRTFLERRILRIVPPYWTMTSVMLLYVLLRGFAASDSSPAHVIASYFFVPWRRPSGALDPVYGIGWTLNYEMFFYVAFACVIAARREAAVATLSAIFVGLVTIRAFMPNLPTPLFFWTDSIILEFLLGMLLALIHQKGLRLPAQVSWALAAVSAAGFAWSLSPQSHFIPEGIRWIRWGIPAGFLVGAVTLVRTPIFVPRFVNVLGDASYAIYLVHPAVINLVRSAAARRLYFQPTSTPWAYMLGSVALSVLAALIFHLGYEKPKTTFLKCRFAMARQQKHDMA